MTYHARRLLFLICVIFFVVAALPLIFYAFGWRFIWEEWALARTGGLFVASFPSTETKIFVDGKLRKETSLISRSLFLGQLSPGFHQVRMARDGYYEWNKMILVKPELVTELKAILVPQIPEAYQVLRNQALSAIFYAPEENTLFLKDITKKWFRFDSKNETLIPAQPPHIKKEPPLLLASRSYKDFEEDAPRGRLLWWGAHEAWVYWDSSHLPHYQSFETEQIMQTPYDIRSAAFYPRREAILVAVSNAVMVVELDGRGGRNITSLYKGKEPSFSVNPSQRVVYILDDGTLIRIPL